MGFWVSRTPVGWCDRFLRRKLNLNFSFSFYKLVVCVLSMGPPLVIGWLSSEVWLAESLTSSAGWTKTCTLRDVYNLGLMSWQVKLEALGHCRWPPAHMQWDMYTYAMGYVYIHNGI